MYVYHALGNALSAYLIPKKKKKKKKKKKRKKKSAGASKLILCKPVGPSGKTLTGCKADGGRFQTASALLFHQSWWIMDITM